MRLIPLEPQEAALREAERHRQDAERVGEVERPLSRFADWLKRQAAVPERAGAPERHPAPRPASSPASRPADPERARRREQLIRQALAQVASADTANTTPARKTPASKVLRQAALRAYRHARDSDQDGPYFYDGRH